MGVSEKNGNKYRIASRVSFELKKDMEIQNRFIVDSVLYVGREEFPEIEKSRKSYSELIKKDEILSRRKLREKISKKIEEQVSEYKKFI